MKPINRQSGLTLIELMIAITLGLILIAGVAQVFLGQRHTYAFGEAMARIQENGRFAVAQIENDVRMAGYMGCLSDVRLFNNLGGAVNTFRDDLVGGIQGYEYSGTAAGSSFTAAATDPAPSTTPGSWSPSLPTELGSLVIPGSDVLVVRYVSADSSPLVSPFSDSAQLVIDPPHNFAAGQIMVVTDCQKASIFQLTAATAAGTVVNLTHTGAGGFSPGNGTASWGSAQGYGLSSEVAPYQVAVYYVGQGASGAPSLFVRRLDRLSATSGGFTPPIELAEGVDTMQVRYGVDTDADRTVDSWLAADSVPDWADVVSAEIALVLRSGEEYGGTQDTGVYNAAGLSFNPVDDRRLRHVIRTTTSIRNRLP